MTVSSSAKLSPHVAIDAMSTAAQPDSTSTTVNEEVHDRDRQNPTSAQMSALGAEANPSSEEPISTWGEGLIDRYEIIVQIGEGTYGQVRLVLPGS
jgi:hypothetical protein